MKPDPSYTSEEMLKQAVKRTLREIDAFKEASRLLPLQIEEELAGFIRETEALLAQTASRRGQETAVEEKELRVRKLSLPGLRQALAAALPPVAVRRSVFSPGYPNRLKLKKVKSLRRVVKSRKKKAKAKRQARIVAVEQAQRKYPAAADRPQSHTSAIRERTQPTGGGARGAGKASAAASPGSGGREQGSVARISAMRGSAEWVRDQGSVAGIQGSSEWERSKANVAGTQGSGGRDQANVDARPGRGERGMGGAGDSGNTAAVSYIGRPERAGDGERGKEPRPQIGVIAIGAKWTHPDFSGASVWPQDRRRDNANTPAPIQTSSNLRFRLP